MQLITSTPAVVLAHPALALFAVAFAAGALWFILSGRRPATVAAPPVDDAEDMLRGLRIVADDGDRAAWTYAPAWAIEAGRPRPALPAAQPEVDDTAWLDPMRADYTAPGVGSVTTLATLAEDTKLRGPQALAELEAAEVEAYVEAERRGLDDLFAGFDSLVADGLARIDQLQASRWGWSFYAHDDAGAHCLVCQHDVDEISGEYRQILSGYDTRAWDVRELRAALTAA